MNALLPMIMSALSIFHPVSSGAATGAITLQTAGGTNGGPIFKASTTAPVRAAGGTNGGPIFKAPTTAPVRAAGGTNGGPIFKH